MSQPDELRRNTMRIKLPFVTCDESGDVWWTEGHHPPDTFLLAMLAHCANQEGSLGCLDVFWPNAGPPLSYPVADIETLRGDVVHLWMKARPDDVDGYDPCDSTDPDAEPFTQVLL